MSGSVDEIVHSLQSKGVYVSGEWTQQCIQFLETQGHRVNDPILQLYIVILSSDLRGICANSPFDCISVDSTAVPGGGHLLRWSGLYLLQVEEITNVGIGAEKRLDKSDNSNRMLKIRLTDGANTLVAVELGPVQGLSAQTPPGTKIILIDPIARHGVLLLTDLTCRVTGGGAPTRAPLEQTTHAESDRVQIIPHRPVVNANVSAVPALVPSRRVEHSNENENNVRAMDRTLIGIIGTAPQPTKPLVEVAKSPTRVDIYMNHEDSMDPGEFEDQFHSCSPDADELAMMDDMYKSVPTTLPERRVGGAVSREDTSSRQENNGVIKNVYDIVSPVALLRAAERAVDAVPMDVSQAEPLIPPPPEDMVIDVSREASVGHSGSFYNSNSDSLGEREIDKGSSVVSATPLCEIVQIMSTISGSQATDLSWTVLVSTTGVSKFKVKGNEYQVVLWLEDKGKDVTDMSTPAVEVSVSDDICSTFLSLSAADYAAMTSQCNKAEAKEYKNQLCLRFETFSGLFLVKPASALPATAKKSSGKKSGGSQSQGPAPVCIVETLEFY